MSSNTTTRWTVSVSKETDISVRNFLAQRGMKQGDLSKFIEDAVKWRMFDQTMAEARSKFADLPPEALDSHSRRPSRLRAIQKRERCGEGCGSSSQYSIRINSQWRICFVCRMARGGPSAVEIDRMTHYQDCE